MHCLYLSRRGRFFPRSPFSHTVSTRDSPALPSKFCRHVVQRREDYNTENKGDASTSWSLGSCQFHGPPPLLEPTPPIDMARYMDYRNNEHMHASTKQRGLLDAPHNDPHVKGVKALLQIRRFSACCPFFGSQRFLDMHIVNECSRTVVEMMEGH